MIRKEEHQAQLSEKPLQQQEWGNNHTANSATGLGGEGRRVELGVYRPNVVFCRKLLETGRDGGGNQSA